MSKLNNTSKRISDLIEADQLIDLPLSYQLMEETNGTKYRVNFVESRFHNTKLYSTIEFTKPISKLQFPNYGKSK